MDSCASRGRPSTRPSPGRCHRLRRGGLQQRRQLSQSRRQHPVVDPRPAPLAGDQTRLAQHRQMVRDRRLGHLEGAEQVADARPALSVEAISDRSRRRTGSDSALNTRASSPADCSSSGSGTRGVQHADAVITGSSCFDTARYALCEGVRHVPPPARPPRRRPRRIHRVLLRALRRRARLAAPGVCQLRHRRASAQARPH
jgi:hypothetical protein